jgi:signal peptidase I
MASSVWKLGRWALFAVTLVATLALAPRQVGGAATYVRTSGISMAPDFAAGDLAIVRAADDYRVGDIVAYRSALHDQTVLHRIIARKGDRFVFQGDNNDEIDVEELGPEQVLGRLWVHVPSGGNAFEWLGQPVHALLFVGTLTLSSGALFQRRVRRRTERTAARRRHPVSLPVVSPSVAFGAAAAGTVCLIVAGVAFLRPATATVPEDVSFRANGELSYSAEVPDGPVYDDGMAETGEPVFLRLARDVDLHFAWDFSSQASHEVAGSIGIDARIETPTGWSRTITVTSPRRFDGSRAEVDGTLNLEDVQRMVDAVATATGANSGPYDITVRPVVELEGTVDGVPVRKTTESDFTFQVDSLQFSPTTDTFTTTHDDAVQRPSQHDRELTDVGPGLTVEQARTGGLAVGGVLLLVAAILALLARPGRVGEAARIKARYGRLLVPVDAAGGSGHKSVIEVPTFRTLVRLADHYERLVLHHQRDGRHTYLLDVDDSLYRYTAKQTR